MPGDPEWPSEDLWQEFDTLLGGALLEGTPSASVCYLDWPDYDQERCDKVTELWLNATWQYSFPFLDAPTGLSFPIFEGVTCIPPIYARANATCTLGGMPAYIVNITTVAQIQLALNFARNLNLRFNIKNTGHDFSAKSTGAGALSIWTHNLRDIQYLGESYADTSGRVGAAFKIGSGVTVGEMYKAADAQGLQVTGGLVNTVGIGGGYSAGGGNGPLISKYGMASDQVISMEVVLPDGRFVSVDEDNYSDLFFALRGGGGSTWAVVTSLVFRAYPRTPITKLAYTFGSGASSNSFWAGVGALFAQFPHWPKAGLYSYWSISCANTTGCVFSMTSQFAPDLRAKEAEALSKPLFDRLAELSVAVENLTVTEYDTYLAAFDDTFPESTNQAGIWNFHTASRLFPVANWENPQKLSAQMILFRHDAETYGEIFGYNLQPAANSVVNQTNAVTPAWRDTCLFLMASTTYTQEATPAEIAAANKALVDRLQPWREMAPDSGAYLNEADINEPNLQQTFYGDNYQYLYSLKQQYDPWGVLYAATAVGAEDWYITDQIDYYPTQNGRLCRV
ncbi:hypothetical protein TruAng_001597 [Truncatella angustata]|nr:hypothetical protein TruAng_001597 [Truncatella angustata]